MKYRPWGPVDWALSLSSQKPWHFVGAIGTEERSLTSWEHMKNLGALRSELFAEIQDVDSEKYRDRTRNALKARRAQFSHIGGNVALVEKMELMVELFRVIAFGRRAETAAASVVLDITSFPKRFFFPILRMLAGSLNVQNLLVTYTSPASYAPDDEPLYEDIEPWRVLPGFGGAGTGEVQWVVSVGFLVESLRKYVGESEDMKLKLLIPFPAPLSVLRRTWESVANLECAHNDGRFEKFRVETLDMSAAFDRIRQLAGHPERLLAFAPFGPKPTSAAMCLYAMQRGSSVHYPQPTVYHPEYSRGIRNDDSATAVSAYWIKHEGENLYTV
jgi:hypothetical protein